MRESCTYGSKRGAPSNGRPYRDMLFAAVHESAVQPLSEEDRTAWTLAASSCSKSSTTASANPCSLGVSRSEPTAAFTTGLSFAWPGLTSLAISRAPDQSSAPMMHRPCRIDRAVPLQDDAPPLDRT